MNIKLATLLLLFLTFSAAAQEPVDTAVVRKIRDEGLKRSKVMETAFQLTDVSGPRLSGSPGLKRAQEWAIKQLKQWGLTNARNEPWGKFGKGWEIQKNYAAITTPYYHTIIAIPKAWTPGTNGLFKSEILLIEADSLPDLEKYKGQLKGKAVIYDVKTTLKQSFKPDAVRYSDSALLAMAQAKAAIPPASRIAILRARALRQAMNNFLSDEGAGLILSMARGTDGTVFTTNGAPYADSARTAAPELETSGEDYLRIIRLLKAGKKVEIEADIKTQFFTNDMQGYNVIAEMPGMDKRLKEQVVMLGAHIDSWHGATGATDNAAGTAVMMEAVRILKAIGFKPKRTIRIALWSSEEQGLHGSKNYVFNHFGNPKANTLKPEHGKVSAYYNLDNGGGKIRGIYLQGNAAAAPVFKAWLAPFHDLGAATVTINNTASTDHISFDNVGIPGFQFIQDSMDYGTRTHHSNQDTFDKLSEDDLKQAAVIVASFVYHTAQRKEMIPRKAPL
ncbi:peptidase M28 [Mucilaginibacter hurinus]|uniref:Carboxypeptidase Q n=1 Tax=Mucilaginibacter hurinus TaxID=2201324 RepID=A0A367GM11_9SPHI|nr:M20/M25/M40 family metallo-hydrolase [Mucilaginibacter hurinus]RCH54499.1 peptidase M28 [Mucilaginibacter hurinus]